MTSTNKYVLVSDVHGNAPALKAVVDKEGLDKEYVILGDIMGLNAYPNETVELVKKIGHRVLGGNHDKAIFERNEGHVVSEELSEFELSHTVSNLTEQQQEWMRELPYLDVIEKGGQRICLTHAYPWPNMASGYESGNSGVAKRDVLSVAATVGSDYDWVFHGHTHQQYDLDCTKFGHDVHFVNPGSLGYDSTYSIVNVEDGTVSHKSVEYSADVKGHVQELLPDNAPHTDEWF